MTTLVENAKIMAAVSEADGACPRRRHVHGIDREDFVADAGRHGETWTSKHHERPQGQVVQPMRALLKHDGSRKTYRFGQVAVFRAIGEAGAVGRDAAVHGRNGSGDGDEASRVVGLLHDVAHLADPEDLALQTAGLEDDLVLLGRGADATG